jgi:hypothetical protein
VSSPPALDAAQRSQLERLILTARRLLEEDLRAQAEGRFGLHSNGRVEPAENLYLDPTGGDHRRVLVEIVDHLRGLGEAPNRAIARILREATFTHLNRLVAIRVAEAAGILSESLGRGAESAGFRQLAEVAPLVADDYWGYLRLCADELAADAPALFDPRNPLLALEPTPRCIDQLVELFANQETGPVWNAADTLGWAYQFFNTSNERRQLREESPAPRDSRELAVRNQFFTPRYVVDFLVQNTLGRRIVEDEPSTPLLDELPLLVDPPVEPGPPVDLDHLKILDPACGSGHFLLGCYDLLERAWQLRGVEPAEAATRIVPTLWGVDIDLRCAQIASAAILLRARRHCRGPLPRPTIVTARELPGGDLTEELDADLGRVVKAMADTLAQAPVLGVLLKAEERMEGELRGMAFGRGPGVFQLTDDAFEDVERRLLDALRRLTESTTATTGERLFAAEAGDAVRLLDICRSRFDVVLMNPPFGEPVQGTKPFLRAAYPWLPNKDNNLLAAFVGRGLELCRPDGYLGAITSRAGMFLTTFAAWRTEVLLGNRLTALVDLGYGVMEQALVEAAAYAIAPGKPQPGDTATFVRLLKDTNRPLALVSAIANDRVGEDERRFFRVPVTEFAAVPGSPLAYWMSPSIRRLFTDLPPLEGNGAEVRVGLQTGDDFRFVRAFWEVDAQRIARSSEETCNGKRWCPFAKGGEYSPYWADIHLVVDFEDDGRRLREFEGSVIRNPGYYFRPGLTWSRRTASSFAIRALPAGCCFSDLGSSVFCQSYDLPAIEAFLSSRLARALLEVGLASGDETSSGGAARHYNVGLVQRLPAAHVMAEGDPGRLTLQVVFRLAGRDALDETTRRFVAPVLPANAALSDTAAAELAALDVNHLTVLDETLESERLLYAAVGIDDIGLRYLDEEIGPHPAAYQKVPIEDRARFERLYTTPMDPLIDEVVAAKGGSRAITNLTYFADRRLEVLAHAFERHPEVIVSLRQELSLMPPGFLVDIAEDLVSYLVGCAFGRWDVRVGQDPSLAPPPPGLFDPVPVCSPGMLVGRDGSPATKAPDGYPLKLPPGRILIDEPGHPWDADIAVLRVAESLFDDANAIIAEVLQILGRKSLREYLRRDFFRSHLRRYSKSRRKAPIYWPLGLKRGQWGVWVYAPILSREVLYAVVREARRRERLASEAIPRLEGEKARGGDGRQVRKVIEELDAEARLLEELRVFRGEAERVAEVGWEPDLDDGIILNAAALADLFPAWPEAAAERKNIKAGSYPWASVSRWTDKL